jgi:hypothetical protein
MMMMVAVASSSWLLPPVRYVSFSEPTACLTTTSASWAACTILAYCGHGPSSLSWRTDRMACGMETCGTNQPFRLSLTCGNTTIDTYVLLARRDDCVRVPWNVSTKVDGATIHIRTKPLGYWMTTPDGEFFALEGAFELFSPWLNRSELRWTVVNTLLPSCPLQHIVVPSASVSRPLPLPPPPSSSSLSSLVLDVIGILVWVGFCDVIHRRQDIVWCPPLLAFVYVWCIVQSPSPSLLAAISSTTWALLNVTVCGAPPLCGKRCRFPLQSHWLHLQHALVWNVVQLCVVTIIT